MPRRGLDLVKSGPAATDRWDSLRHCLGPRVQPIWAMRALPSQSPSWQSGEPAGRCFDTTAAALLGPLRPGPLASEE